jgi:S-disulfanyl-L-cysteine oxidoreductase SoxD
MTARTLLVCTLILGGANGVSSARPPQAQPAERTVWEGVYTQAQADRGEKAYKLSCGYCHKDDLSGGFFDDGNGRAPALAGARAFDSSFEKRWTGVTVGEMVIDIGTAMPQKDPGSLPPETYVDIISFLLSKNGVPAGARELPADLEALQSIRVTAKPGAK